MRIKKVLYIEDNREKYMEVRPCLGRQKLTTIDWARSAESAVDMVEESVRQNDPYDLIISDMHFDFYGQDDQLAGEKTLNLLREKDINIPIVFCSRQNWRIPGAFGSIFFNENRDWEIEADELFAKLRAMK